MEENTWHQLMASPNVHACTRVHIHALHLYSYMLPHMQICTCIIHIHKHKPCARACMHAHKHTQIGKHKKVKQWPGVLSLPADKWPSLHQLCLPELRTSRPNNCCFWSLFCIFPLGEELLEVSKPRILSTPFSLLGICISQRHVNICFVWCGMLSQMSCTSLVCAVSHCPWAQSDCFSWLCPWTDDSSVPAVQTMRMLHGSPWASPRLCLALVVQCRVQMLVKSFDGDKLTWFEFTKDFLSEMSLFRVWLCSLF